MKNPTFRNVIDFLAKHECLTAFTIGLASRGMSIESHFNLLSEENQLNIFITGAFAWANVRPDSDCWIRLDKKWQEFIAE